MWNEVKGIYVMDDLGGTPASARLSTGEIFINNSMFWDLSPDERLFILLHEAGHIVLNTRDELAADEWAHEQYTKMDGDLNASVTAFEGMNIPERQLEQLKRALHYDAHENGNMQALSDLMEMDSLIEDEEGSTMGLRGEQTTGTNWIGAAIAGVTALGSMIFGDKKEEEARKAQQKMLEEQAAAQERMARLNMQTMQMQAEISAMQTKTAMKILLVLAILGAIGYAVYAMLIKRKANQ